MSVGSVNSAGIAAHLLSKGTITRQAVDQQGEITQDLIQSATQTAQDANPNGTISVQA